ncbi:hypothetical protein [Neolewinella persica]|uniref:hypothetical protein n=1 Tax=Neolewinella persica TaxID=70998 RepID=UPI0003729211|nr:hypothetical protein [Neolewinella persica]
MIRIALLFIFSFLVGFLSAQETRPAFTEGGFEEEALRYAPPQRAGVSDKDYSFGQMVLEETVRQTEDDATDFNRADYFNVLSAFLTLKEPPQAIDLAFKKFLFSPGSCEYLIEFWETVKSNPKYTPIREDWEKAKAECEQDDSADTPPFSLTQYARDYLLDPDLVRLMQKLDERDQRFRKGEYQPKLQTPLDRENERIVDSLYAVYGRYIGNDLVGDKFETVMWVVIQHSQLETMERYLPVVQQAVHKANLAAAPLRMLIDRVYTQKTGRQVFGSQQGVALMPEADRERIIREYGLE